MLESMWFSLTWVLVGRNHNHSEYSGAIMLHMYSVFFYSTGLLAFCLSVRRWIGDLWVALQSWCIHRYSAYDGEMRCWGACASVERTEKVLHPSVFKVIKHILATGIRIPRHSANNWVKTAGFGNISAQHFCSGFFFSHWQWWTPLSGGSHDNHH